MADAISIPSPSLFLSSPDPSPSTQTPPAKKPARRQPQPTLQKKIANGPDGNLISKRKLSKSRDGCATCKAKRLKCDETKPTCKQCARRSVVCEGYKKNFKWKSFEEASFTGKSAGKPRKSVSSPVSEPAHAPPRTPPAVNGFYTPLVNTPTVYNNVQMQPVHTTVPQPAPTPTFVSPTYTEHPDMFPIQHSVQPFMPVPPTSPIDRYIPSSVESSIYAFETDSVDTKPAKTTAASSVSSGQSPRLLDLLLPGTDLSVPPEEYMEYRSQHPDSFYQPSGLTPPAEGPEEEDIEEVPRDFSSDWVSRLPSPTPSNSSASSSDSGLIHLLKQPHFPKDSPEALMLRFDRDTCGILSVKNGPSENPWRDILWPLARNSRALYHAIASMTSFHLSKGSSFMKYQGIGHARMAMEELASGLTNMHIHAAISTTLVLAFSESWDHHITTGRNHIKGAKLLLDGALVQHKQCPTRGEEYERLKFLCNSWLYMDVIARLTSTECDDSSDFDDFFDILDIRPDDQKPAQMDPLMGCASTLFPIIGRVANLVRKARLSESNSPSIISQAIELRTQLEEWETPTWVETPQDETTTPHDTINTALAYKYATLLYLHQAVPEIRSPSSAWLARKTLCHLASVHPSSRCVIVQIYPLMAAGCEAVTEEDRAWVQDRWEMLNIRMKIGIIEKSWQVTQEVWKRRDAHFAAELARVGDDGEAVVSPTSALKRGFSSISEDAEGDGLFCWLPSVQGHARSNKRRAVSSAGLMVTPYPVQIKEYQIKQELIKQEADEEKTRLSETPPTELLPPEFTVRGKLHWLGVMRDKEWEILLG